MKRPTRVVIVAAGEGRRFGSPKQFSELKGRSLLDRCLERFDSHPDIAEIILVLGDSRPDVDFPAAYRKITAVVSGGKERQDSTAAGVDRLTCDPDDIVLVHDGARPLVSEELIGRIIEAARRTGAAVPVLPLNETVKRVEDGRITETLDRERLRRVQTPQGFRGGILRQALERAQQENFLGTDEAVLVERMGHPVEAVPGDWRNIKITTPQDLRIAEVIIEL